jgi:hypothetical protein
VEFAASLKLPEPPKSEADAFGASIGTWPPHPDTIAALKILKKQYGLAFIPASHRVYSDTSNSLLKFLHPALRTLIPADSLSSATSS